MRPPKGTVWWMCQQRLVEPFAGVRRLENAVAHASELPVVAGVRTSDDRVWTAETTRTNAGVRLCQAEHLGVRTASRHLERHATPYAGRIGTSCPHRGRCIGAGQRPASGTSSSPRRLPRGASAYRSSGVRARAAGLTLFLTPVPASLMLTMVYVDHGLHRTDGADVDRRCKGHGR